MARPIAPTPPLKGADAERFVELAKNPPPLKPVKLLTKKQVKKLFNEVILKKEK
jgi:hypothetical protein